MSNYSSLHFKPEVVRFTRDGVDFMELLCGVSGDRKTELALPAVHKSNTRSHSNIAHITFRFSINQQTGDKIDWKS